MNQTDKVMVFLLGLRAINVLPVVYHNDLTIRLWAQDFCCIIIDEGKGKIAYHLENESNLF